MVPWRSTCGTGVEAPVGEIKVHVVEVSVRHAGLEEGVEPTAGQQVGTEDTVQSIARWRPCSMSITSH